MNDSEEKTFRNSGDDSFSREMYFPTTVFNITCAGHEALNRYLLDLTYAERERDLEGIERSNFRGLGGWHSHTMLHRGTQLQGAAGTADEVSSSESESVAASAWMKRNPIAKRVYSDSDCK